MTKKHLFRRLLTKVISMALWTKASLCVKSSLLEQSLPGTPSRPKTCLPHEIAQRYLFGVISASKNLYNLLSKICAICGKNQRNLRLINDLRSTKDYVRNYKLFLQNKPKFRKSQMNVTNVLTKDYVQMDTWSSGTKQSQTNPNKAKSKKAKMNVTSILTVGYENKSPIRAPKKQSQIPKRQKPMQTSLAQRIMENTRFLATKKQTQFKPKQTQFQTSFTPCKPFLFLTFLYPCYNLIKRAGRKQAASGSTGLAEYLSNNIEVQYRYECC